MKLNIAVIDDIPHDIETAADMVKMYFEQNNFFSVNISGFENADSFFKAYTKNFFQIVLVDICMNGMNGLELSQRLRGFDSRLSS